MPVAALAAPIDSDVEDAHVLVALIVNDADDLVQVVHEVAPLDQAEDLRVGVVASDAS